MARFISAELSHLIKARSYAEGHLETVNRKAEKLRPQVERLARAKKAVNREIKRLDQEIRRLAPDLDPTEIRPRKYIRRRTWKYGEFTRYLLWLMNQSNGAVIPTIDLVAATAREFKIPLKPYSEWDFHRKRVTGILCEWVEEGYVERLHKKDGTEEGRWRLIAPIAIRPRDGARSGEH